VHEDHGDTQAPDEAQEQGDEYVPPTLTDLGSFEDLTQLSPTGPNPDSEGFST
jgi:hypothetical protein